MKTLGIVLCMVGVTLIGCSGEPKADPAKDEALKASFSKKPDINTLNPGMRKMVDSMIANSKNGKPPTSVSPPANGK